MSIHTQSKCDSRITLGARLFILVLLVTLLSSCGTVLQTPLPTAPQELTLLPPTEVPTAIEMPTLTPTLEPTATQTPEPSATQTLKPTAMPTQEIFVPDAPKNADPEKWREGYINGMQAGGYIGLKIEAGLAVPSWDAKMETIIWTLGRDKFGYNSEFKFTGEVVPDIYTNKWIVRKRLTQPSGYAGSIWMFDSLHVKDSQNLIIGYQCIRQNNLDQTSCAIVGQIVGQEKIDFSQYLIDDFDSLSFYDAGIFWKRSNLVFDALIVRVPTGYDTYVEIRVPITPENWSKVKTISNYSTPSGGRIKGEDVLQRSKNGSMIYLMLGASHGRPDGMTEEEIKALFTSDREWGNLASISEAFGAGDHVALLFKNVFNVHIYGPFLETLSGRPKIFVTEKLVEDLITPKLWGLLIK